MGEQDDSPRPGFDFWASHKGQGEYFDNTFNINGRPERRGGYYTHAVTDLAVDWLGRQGPRTPFCLILGHKAPHTPFTPEPKYATIYDGIDIRYPESAFDLAGKPEWVRQRLDTWHGIYGPLYGYRKDFPDRRPESVRDFTRFVRSYTATLNSVDDSVGRVYAALARAGVLDDTIFVFAGDNGSFLGEHGMTDKRTMHEESIRVPLLVRYPRAIRGGTVIRPSVLNIDLAPSLLDLAGARPLEGVHGLSWRPLLAGRPAGWRSSWLYEYNYEKQFPYTPNVRGVRTEEWKYVHYPHGDGGPDRHRSELYNLRRDPHERRNLIDEPACAGKVAELKAELASLLTQTGSTPDAMPLDEGVKTHLPEKSIR